MQGIPFRGTAWFKAGEGWRGPAAAAGASYLAMGVLGVSDFEGERAITAFRLFGLAAGPSASADWSPWRRVDFVSAAPDQQAGAPPGPADWSELRSCFRAL